MKTIQKADKIKRVDNETAGIKVRNEGYSLVSKKIWKENMRDVNKNDVKIEEKGQKTQKKHKK